ncbi:MAG: putative Rossmann fold flavoprotein [Arenicella sp.]|jgi:predicted Rossmann fold flavoprotein
MSADMGTDMGTSAPAIEEFDVIVLGGGAAGLMAAFIAGQRGKSVAVLEVSNKLGKKILMSGGGRCNFTNLEVTSSNFICQNTHFVKSALAQYSQWDFIALVAKHGVAYHEKGHGQLFCDKSSKDILKILVDECKTVNVDLRLNCETFKVARVDSDGGYLVETNQGVFSAPSLIVATGGLSIPSLGGATGLGYQLAEQFGLSLNTTEASLVPMTLSGKWQNLSTAISGVALPVVVSVASKAFAESMLFTHRGLSGPAILQLSNYWNAGEPINIDLLPTENAAELFVQRKKTNPKSMLSGILANFLPKSLVAELQARWWPEHSASTLHEMKNEDLQRLGELFNSWSIRPSGTEGYRTAEVTRGGVNVDGISSKTMAVNGQPTLFFIGEALDVTGHLGGFNFQWAWSSGYVAGVNA